MPCAQGVFARLECLGEPVATVGALQSLGKACRVGQQRTPIWPDERVKLLGRTLTGLTALVMLRGKGWNGKRHIE